MQGILYEEPSFWTFAFITVLLGGWAAWMTGKANAQNWHSPMHVVMGMVLLGVAVRFIHFAVFEGTFLSLRYYIVDTIVVTIIALVSYRLQMTEQMCSRYWWEVEKTGPFSWRKRSVPLETRQISR